MNETALLPSLHGLRVIESATMLAAPFTGMLLGDHGADVIKIELPGEGDGLRHWGNFKDGVPLFWKVIGRNKRSVTLDLRKPRGRDLFLRLIATADVYIENFRPGTLDRWHIGIDVLRSVKPDLIVLHMSGYGQTGPDAPKPGFGTLAEAMSGFAYVNGWPDSPPTLPPFGLADSIAGIAGAFGILAALRRRDATGLGSEVDLALYEPLLSVMGSTIIDVDQLGFIQERNGNTTPFTAPRNAYRTRDDRWIAMSSSNQASAARLFAAIGKPELLDDERFKSNAGRVKHAVELDDHVAAWVLERTYDEAMAVFAQCAVTAGPIYSSADVFADAHVRARGSIVQVEDEELGPVWMQAPFPRIPEAPGSIRTTGRKVPGQDNASVLVDELGLSEDELASLREEGIVS